MSNIDLLKSFFKVVATTETQENETPSAQVIENTTTVNYIPLPNITDLIDDQMLEKIGQKAVKGYEDDKKSMDSWTRVIEKGKELLEQATEGRTDQNAPWPGSSNYKASTLQAAGMTLANRMMQEIFRQEHLIKIKINGTDADDNKEKEKRSDRLQAYSNWQLWEDMAEWYDEHVKLLYDLPFFGCVFKRIFYDSQEGRVASKLITYPNFIVDHNCHSMNRLRRFTEDNVDLTQDEILSRQRTKVWRDVSFEDESKENTNIIAEEAEKKDSQYDPNKIETFIEQDGFYDIDKDGLAEPYTFVVHRDSEKVVRIIPRFAVNQVFVKKYNSDEVTTLDQASGEGWQVIKIIPEPYPEKYGLFHDPFGGLLDCGYFSLLNASTDFINTITNQLIDSGVLANKSTGLLGKGVREQMGMIDLVPGRLMSTNIPPQMLQGGIKMIDFKEPSAVLKTLRDDIVNNARELTASVDLESVLQPNAPATTSLVMLEEQLLNTSAVMMRVYNSMSREFKRLFKLNGIYTDPELYQSVVDDPEADFEKDFDMSDLDITPSANPQVISKMQRIQQSMAEMQQLQVLLSVPGFNARPVIRNFFDVTGLTDPDEVLPDENGQQILQRLMQQNPEIRELITQEQQAAQQAQQVQQQQLQTQLENEQLKNKRLMAEIAEKEAGTDERRSKVLLNEVTADAKEMDTDIKRIKAPAEIDKDHADAMHAMAQAGREESLTKKREETLHGKNIN